MRKHQGTDVTQLSNIALDQLFRRARTRNGWSDRAITTDDIRQIYKLAKFGATSANSNPGRFVWVKSDAQKSRLADCASDSNARKIRQAPVTVIIARDLDFAEHLSRLFPHAPQMRTLMSDPEVAIATARRNATLQGAYLMMAARALGFDCGPMSGFDNAKVDTEFFAGTSLQSDFLCSIGFGTEEGLFDRLPRLEFQEANQVI